MRTFDFSPLFRSSVGFDRLAQLMDAARDDVPSYPPYNIERTGEDQYRITMAVAGFAENDIEITAQENALTVVGKQPKDEAPKSLLARSHSLYLRIARLDDQATARAEGNAVASGGPRLQ